MTDITFDLVKDTQEILGCLGCKYSDPELVGKAPCCELPDKAGKMPKIDKKDGHCLEREGADASV